jgi:hypothetical protein
MGASTFFIAPMVHTSNISSCQQKFFSFPVAVNNSTHTNTHTHTHTYYFQMAQTLLFVDEFSRITLYMAQLHLPELAKVNSTNRKNYIKCIITLCVFNCGCSKAQCLARILIQVRSCVVWGFRREVDKNCALLSYYAASSGNFLPPFRDNLSVQFSKNDDGTDRLSRNAGKELPLLAE